ncbi:hypothetical protein Avbf_14365 [Armadillidium vulgare]|nr:hypothetical protein Avbf_14365 [Armadillidium vulgare]
MFKKLIGYPIVSFLRFQNSGPRDEFAAFLDESTADENMMTLRGRASMISALSTADVPKITLNIGGCHGDDNYTMCGPSFNQILFLVGLERKQI